MFTNLWLTFLLLLAGSPSARDLQAREAYSKSHHIPDLVSMATAPETTADQPRNPPRDSADSPAGIADLFNRFFASVFTFGSPVEEITCEPSDTVMVDLTLAVTTVQAAPEALEVGKTTGPDEIAAKLLKETASAIAPSLCKIFNKSLQLGSLPSEWKLANGVPVTTCYNNNLLQPVTTCYNNWPMLYPKGCKRTQGKLPSHLFIANSVQGLGALCVEGHQGPSVSSNFTSSAWFLHWKIVRHQPP